MAHYTPLNARPPPNEDAPNEDDGDSPADFIERSFSPSVDLSMLALRGVLEKPSSQPESRRLDSSSTQPRALAHAPVTRKMWNPLWLSPLVLLSFSVLFVGIFVVVLALYLYSKNNNGLLNGSEDMHYVWTYLPTAIFVLTAALWHRVDFFCKELTPYYEMSQGPVPARQSISLDYIMPWLPKNLWRAVKYRHWAVVSSISVHMLLKLATVLSSSLLILAPTQIEHQTDSFETYANFSTATLNLDDVAADPVDWFYGTTGHGLPWRYGSGENLTVQTFGYNGTDTFTDALLTAEVLGFSVGMECEPAQIGSVGTAACPWYQVFASCLEANVSTPGCQLSNVTLGRTYGHSNLYVPINNTGYHSNYQGQFDYYVCNSNFDYELSGAPNVSLPNATSPDQYRFFLSMSEVSFYYNASNAEGAGDAMATSNWTIPRSTGVMCKPSYSLDRYKVTLVPSNQTLSSAVLIPDTSTDLIGLTMEDLLKGIFRAIIASNFGDGGPDFVIYPVPPLFGMLAGLNNMSRQEALMDSNLLLNLSTLALQGIGTQFADRYLQVAQSSPISGSIVAIQQRLVVNPLSVGLLLATLTLLFLGVLVLIKARPWNAAPCPTETMTSSAAILAASEELRQHFQAIGDSSTASADRDFRTVVNSDGAFIILPTVTAPKTQTASPRPKVTGRKKEPQPWWRPMATKLWFSICILILPVILIAVLEVVQQVSDKHHGIATLGSSDDYHLAISYLPILLMLLVAALYGALDSTASIFAPFLALHRGNAPAERSMSTNLVSGLAPHSFYLSLRNRHWANCFTVTAAFLSGFLTIVASGLYSPGTVQSSHSIQVRQMDAFNFSHVDLSEDDNLAGTTAKLTLLYNLSFPAWTYGDLVFPSFSAQIPEHLLASNTTLENITISMTVPAIRPSLQCTGALPNSVSQAGNFYHSGAISEMNNLISGSALAAPGVFTYTQSNFSVSLATSSKTPVEHLNGSAHSNGSAHWSVFFIAPNSTERTISNLALGYASALQILVDGQDTTLSDTAMNSQELPGELDVEPSDPTFGIAAGLASGSKTDRIQTENEEGPAFNASIWDIQADMVVAICYQVLEEVQTNVTFNWPNMTTSEIVPPIPNESTARVIMSNETSNPTWFMNASAITTNPATQHWFGVSLNSFTWALQDSTETAQTMNAWFTTLRDAYNGQPLAELLGQKNQGQLLNASSNLYAHYAVQAINANMRSLTPAPGQKLPTYNATLSLPVLRLRQNKAPKIVLQVLLGIIVLCGAIAYTIIDTREVLRQSPCSIAGKMALLARSELCNSRKLVPEGAEWWDERSRRERGLFNGWFFSLGWWGKDTKWYGIDVGRAEKTE